MPLKIITLAPSAYAYEEQTVADVSVALNQLFRFHIGMKLMQSKDAENYLNR